MRKGSRKKISLCKLDYVPSWDAVLDRGSWTETCKHIGTKHQCPSCEGEVQVTIEVVKTKTKRAGGRRK